MGRGTGSFILIGGFVLAAASLAPLSTAAPLPQDPSQLQHDNNQTDPPKDDKKDGDPVVLSSGAFHLDKTDLVIRGRGMDFEFRRTYRSGSSVHSALGHFWDFNWNQKIVLEYMWLPGGPYGGPQSQSMGEGGELEEPVALAVRGAYYFNGELRVDRFVPEGTLPNGWTSPAGYFAKLRHTGGYVLQELPEDFTLRTADGRILTFGLREFYDPFVRGVIYRLTRLEDRHGNAFTLEYTQVGQPPHQYSRLARVRDTYGRAIEFEYTTQGLYPVLARIVDFEGREVEFTHDVWGVTKPLPL